VTSEEKHRIVGKKHGTGYFYFPFILQANTSPQNMKVTAIVAFAAVVLYLELVFEFPIKDYFFVELPQPRLLAQFGGPITQSPWWWLLIHHITAIANLLAFTAVNVGCKVPKKCLVISHVIFSAIFVFNCTVLFTLTPEQAFGAIVGVLGALSVLLYREKYSAYFVVFSAPVFGNLYPFLKWIALGGHYIWFAAFTLPIACIFAAYGTDITITKQNPTKKD
jgi:hypothetical protein